MRFFCLQPVVARSHDAEQSGQHDYNDTEMKLQATQAARTATYTMKK